MIRTVLLGSIVLGSAACRRGAPAPEPAPTVDAGPARVVARSAVASGTTSWFHVHPDDPLLDARLDVGSIHSSEDASVDILVEWPITPGERSGARLQGESIPEDARSFERSRVLCGPTGPLSFPLEIYKLGADGGELARLVYDPTAEKMKAHAWSGRPYGDDVYALACWLAARKCAEQDAPWPASSTAASFVPTCRL